MVYGLCQYLFIFSKLAAFPSICKISSFAYQLSCTVIWDMTQQDFVGAKSPRRKTGKKWGLSHTSDHTPASHTVMQSWPSQRWAVAGFGPRQSLSQALISVPLFSCWVQATCLLCTPFPHVREHVVHSVIIHLKAKQRSLETN